MSLLEDAEASELCLAAESTAAASVGIQFISFPIPDRGTPASMRETMSLLAKLSSLLERGGNVAIHCRQGIGRSGLIASGLLIAAGAIPENAIDAVAAARGQTIPETAPQLDWITRLSARRLIPTP